jgi:predicted O-linked N-acetylglucosamine transferase (SPINDLY family)
VGKVSTQSRKALDRAKVLHQKGDLAEAERLYRAELRRNGGNVDALRLLGLLCAQRGDLEAARQYFDRALGLNPERADLHFLRAEVSKGLGLQEQAIDGYRHALATRPDMAEALINLGDLLLLEGRAADALPLLERALQVRPGDTAALNNRANALQALKRHAEALECYDRVLQSLPGNADVLSNRANALLSLARFAEAEASCGAALERRAAHPFALLNLGRALVAQDRIAEGLECYDAALSIVPEEFDGWCERAMLLVELQRYVEAQASFEKALALRPDSSGTWSDLGAALYCQRLYKKAVAACDRALALENDNAKAHANRAHALRFLNRPEEAVSACETALGMNPQSPYIPGALASQKLALCDWRDHAATARRVVEGVCAGERSAEPFDFLFVSDRADQQLSCAGIFARSNYPPRAEPLWRGERFQHERIRLAYLSGDFRDHATSYLLAGLLEKHDRSRFEVFGISIGPVEASPTAARIEAAFEHFMQVRERTDGEIAALLRRQEIDIVVDLMGFTNFCRPRVFAMRPCPVQVNYLGFPGTLGTECIDYLLGDPFVVPPGSERHYAEKVVKLPETFQANDGVHLAAERVPSRPALGLPAHGAVICAFNKGSKITPGMFDLWMDVLGAVEGSVLWLQGGTASMQSNLQREAKARKVSASRLVFAPVVPYAEHLARLRHADLALDTLPFNGGATTSDALRSGVPVITCPGDAFAARMSGSLLHAIGLPELVTSTLDEYRALAIRLAGNPELLAQTKRKLTANLLTHPLFDTDRFRWHIEAAYETMWQRYQAGAPPAAFSVPALAGGRSEQA